jgi:hypothetical protein
MRRPCPPHSRTPHGEARRVKPDAFLWSFIACMGFLLCSLPIASFPYETHIMHLMEKASYKNAANLLSEVLADRTLSKPETTTALWLHGYCMASEGDKNAAEQDFFRMLQLTLDFFPKPDTPPKIMESFLRARGQYFQHFKTHDDFIADVVSETINANELTLLLRIGKAINASTETIKIYLREIDEATYRSIVLNPAYEQSYVRLGIPIRGHYREILHYYLEFIGRYGEPFLTLGSAIDPRTIAAQIPLIIPQRISLKKDTVSNLKASWPILIGTLIACAGALTYGFLK